MINDEPGRILFYEIFSFKRLISNTFMFSIVYYQFKLLFSCTYYWYIQTLSIFKNVENKLATLPEMQF